MFGKIIKISIISIIALIIVVGGTIGGIYYYGVRQNKAIEVIGKVELAPADAKLGQIVTAAILLKCPWHRKPLEAVAQIAKGASLLNAPEISRQSIGWGYNIWKVSTGFKAYRTGNIPAGKIDVSYNRYDDKTTDLSKMFIIPPFKCAPLHLGKTQKIVIADAIEPGKIISNKKMYIIIAVLTLLIIAAVILFAIRRYKKVKAIILPSWAVALNDLHSLRSNIKSGNITLNLGFISLTDIVRGYLEKRFKLPASKQTTEEFLEGINQKSGPLPKVQRPFLKEFMQAAELVKFAKLPPDENTLNQALGKAETLVNETRPEDTDGGAK
ncbi:MAG: hypothetical protein KAS17_10440 [Victivallaceae bacterium]|nr:hypothetical protein [Victivallaceae bacterium]